MKLLNFISWNYLRYIENGSCKNIDKKTVELIGKRNGFVQFWRTNLMLVLNKNF
jgi:hypothetical protein